MKDYGYIVQEYEAGNDPEETVFFSIQVRSLNQEADIGTTYQLLEKDGN